MSNCVFKRMLAFTMALALTLACCGQAMADQAYVTSAATVYANLNGGRLGTLSVGTKVELVAEKSGWAKIKKDGVTGYMKAGALARVEYAGNVTAYAKADAAVYKGFSSGTGRLGTLPAGTAVTVVACVGSLAYIDCNGRKGYVKSDSLTTQAPEAPAAEAPVAAVARRTVYAAKADAKVYNAQGRAVGSVAINTAFTLVGVNGDVCRVERDGKTAYMRRADLSETATAVEAPVETPATATPAAQATAYVNKEGAVVYSAGGKALARLGLNTAVTVTAVSGDICRVSNGGGTGFMKKSDLSEKKTEAASNGLCVTAYVVKDGAAVYSAGGKALGRLDLNTAVNVTAVSGDICRVDNGNSTGYMRTADLSCEKAGPGGVVDIPNTTGYVNRDGAPVVDASGRQIATLTVNVAVTVTAYSGALCQVTSGSTVGYMKKSDISAQKVAVTDYTLKFGDSGEAVKRVQIRLKELGYFTGDIGGNYQNLTQSAVSAFQSVAKLTVNGVVDARTLEAMFNSDAPKKPADNNAATSNGPTGNSTVAPAKGTAIEMDWWESDIQQIFARGVTAQITDVETGLSWLEQRRGGTNHADVQPLTAADTAALKKAYGGTWSWNRRAIIVTINGVNYAASMNGMPHGSGSIDGNNFDGHHCIHFTNSRTHGGNKVCSLHQAAIRKAAAAVLH